MTAHAAWNAMWREVGAAEGDEALRQRLLDAWSEPQRHYHTRQHLGECLSLFRPVRHLAQRPAEIELGLWFHDAVYDPKRKDNEALSAQWAQEAIVAGGAGADVAWRVARLVMLTCGHEPPQDVDGQLLLDVDLSILGAERQRFDESNEQIRLEYAHVPLQEYRTRRAAILRSFLDRPRLYSTQHFHDLLEARARENLLRAVDRLLSR